MELRVRMSWNGGGLCVCGERIGEHLLFGSYILLFYASDCDYNMIIIKTNILFFETIVKHLKQVIICILRYNKMFCGSEQINFSRWCYTQSDTETFQVALSSIKTEPGSQFNNQLYFDLLANPHTENKPSKSLYTAHYNSLLKEVTIQNHKKQEQFWYCVQQEIAITKGDTLRVGQAILHVHDIYPIRQHNQKKEYKGKQMKINEHETCRICFSNEQHNENPLLSLCGCSGSIKYMHLECYRDWYQTKVKFFNERKITYFQLKGIRCQLCHGRIPFSVVHNDREYTLLDYKQNFSNPIPNMQMMVFPDDNIFSQDSFRDSLQLYNQDQSFIQNPNPLQHPIHQIQPNHQNQILDAQQSHINQPGMYVLLRSQKINEDNQQIIEVILVKLGPQYMVSFGNETGIANIIIKNGCTSKLHMSLNFIGDKVFLFNYSEELGTFIKMRDQTQYQFIGKQGIIVDHVGKQLLIFKQKPWLIKCLQPQTKFKIIYVEKFQNQKKRL